MIVYRITTEQWSKTLQASGNVARWNAKGNFVIYSAGSRSLACLENIVHRSGEMAGKLYKVMLIEIPPVVEVEEVKLSNLKKGWNDLTNFSYCQKVGFEWLKEGKAAILKVPSVIVEMEFNYLINPMHPKFNKIKLIGTEDFGFDTRF